MPQSPGGREQALYNQIEQAARDDRESPEQHLQLFTPDDAETRWLGGAGGTAVHALTDKRHFTENGRRFQPKGARASLPKTAASLALYAPDGCDARKSGDVDFAKVRDAGYSDGEIAEIIAHVALNAFTNSFNTATEVEVDFPRVELWKTA